jgi:hypothetical protein
MPRAARPGRSSIFSSDGVKSHSYDLRFSDWTRLLLPPLLAFAGLVAVAQVIFRFESHRTGGSSATLGDVILEEKARMSRSKSSANTVLIGDSSCLMDVSCDEIRRACPELNCYNLGTLSTLGLPRFSALLQSFLRAQGLADGIQPAAASGHAPSEPAPRPKLVVLLISPEMVRTAYQPVIRPGSKIQDHQKRRLAAQETSARTSFELSHWLSAADTFTAVSRIRTEVADALLEHPLPGRWGQIYGSLRGVRRYLVLHDGCAIDPSERSEGPMAPPLKSAGLSPWFASQCKDFGKVLPPGIHLAVGLTPIPQSEAEPGYPQLCRNIVSQLKEALGADAGLTNLPPTLPDHYFSTSTHLNEMGARQYSHYLGRVLR